MDQETWRKAEDQIEDLSDALDELLDSPELELIRELLGKLSQTAGEAYGVNLTCLVELFDRNEDRTLPLVSMGVSGSSDGDTYRTWDDCSFHRYLVDGEICVVPHDRCPKCWGEWGFKWENRECPCCDAKLGSDCKILLDSDICPQCEEGKVSASEPKCDKCGFEIDPSCVAWG